MPTIWDLQTGKSRAVNDATAANLLRMPGGRYSLNKPRTPIVVDSYGYVGSIDNGSSVDPAYANAYPLYKPTYDAANIQTAQRELEPTQTTRPTIRVYDPYGADYYNSGLTAAEARIIADFKAKMMSPPDPETGVGGWNSWWAVDPATGEWGWRREGAGNIYASFDEQSMPKGVRYDKVTGALEEWYKKTLPPPVDPSDYGDTGYVGGGGGGYAGPVYVAPDRRVVEDYVKAKEISLTGNATPQQIKELADRYMADHRKAWDIKQSGGEDISPEQSVLEMIRGQEDYQRIHKLRTDQQDEDTWISQQMQALQQRGVAGDTAEDMSVVYAQLGVNPNDIDTGALQLSKGQDDIGLMRNIKQAATQIAGLL